MSFQLPCSSRRPQPSAVLPGRSSGPAPGNIQQWEEEDEFRFPAKEPESSAEGKSAQMPILWEALRLPRPPDYPRANSQGEKPQKCSACGKSFTRKESLIIHERFHTGEKPYKCSVSRKTFSEKIRPLIHERTHTGKKLYKCSECGKSFGTCCNLLRHRRVHTGENIPNTPPWGEMGGSTNLRHK
ncbi:zinc finger protein 354C-like [Candoia aspera]|uniref:zinc finger protein 354C-like n=1 Tax=Candoia aspera TaxID=51853 RepID=UPI002FD86F33